MGSGNDIQLEAAIWDLLESLIDLADMLLWSFTSLRFSFLPSHRSDAWGGNHLTAIRKRERKWQRNIK